LFGAFAYTKRFHRASRDREMTCWQQPSQAAYEQKMLKSWKSRTKAVNVQNGVVGVENSNRDCAVLEGRVEHRGEGHEFLLEELPFFLNENISLQTNGALQVTLFILVKENWVGILKVWKRDED